MPDTSAYYVAAYAVVRSSRGILLTERRARFFVRHADTVEFVVSFNAATPDEKIVDSFRHENDLPGVAATLGLPFAERLLPLDTPEFKRDIATISPARRVPVLQHGELRVWDSLAICEYACELAGSGWPRNREVRAVARSVCAEMHAGFSILRSQWPMNARALDRRTATNPERSAELARIEDIWADCRGRFGSGGPWLFGEYSVADAMYAPVVLRMRTYGAHLRDTSAAYVATVLADPHLRLGGGVLRLDHFLLRAEGLDLRLQLLLRADQLLLLLFEANDLLVE